MAFNRFPLDVRLQRAVSAAGFKTATPIQAKAIPAILDGSDVIGTAATGTGKTVAFVLPLLQRLLENPSKTKATCVLVITPTRELAEQIKETADQLSRHTNLRTATVYGGVGFEPQKRALNDGTELIICCPGRFLDHLNKGNTRMDHIKAVVLDEADQMLDMGFLPDIRKILARIPSQYQTLLFSATFAPELKNLIKQNLKNPVRIEIDHQAPTKTVEHCFYPVAHQQKADLLIGILNGMNHNSVLIFTRTKHRADRLSHRIKNEGLKSGVIHSNRTQSQRRQVLERFKKGKIDVLVATDIAARGIDIADVSHVINFDIPDSAITYIHRIGRTGRAERQGDALTLISEQDKMIVREIERSLGYSVERKTIKEFNYSEAEPVYEHKKSTHLKLRKIRFQHSATSMREKRSPAKKRSLNIHDQKKPYSHAPTKC